MHAAMLEPPLRPRATMNVKKSPSLFNQGFPDDWTLIEWKGRPAEECPDTPRYKAIGNSMAVPVMRWIGERVALRRF